MLETLGFILLSKLHCVWWWKKTLLGSVTRVKFIAQKMALLYRIGAELSRVVPCCIAQCNRLDNP